MYEAHELVPVNFPRVSSEIIESIISNYDLSSTNEVYSISVEWIEESIEDNAIPNEYKVEAEKLIEWMKRNSKEVLEFI